MADLYPYQVDGAAYLAQRSRAMLFDEPGLGKTVQAIRAADFVNAASVLAICPASLVSNWYREVERWRVMDWKFTALSYDHVVRNPDLEGHHFNTHYSTGFDVLILDEAHYLKSRDSKRTQTILGEFDRGPAGLASKARYVWVLTGTPAPNNAAEVWPLLSALTPEAITLDGEPMSYARFLTRYCVTRWDGFRERVVGGRNLPELRDRLKTVSLRRRKTDVLPDLPPIRFEPLYVSMDAKRLMDGAAEELQRLEDEQRAEVQNAIQADGAGGLEHLSNSVSALRKLIGRIKAVPVADIVVDELESGLDKIVLFAHHKSVIAYLAARLEGHGAVVVQGSTPAGERQAAVDKFQNDPNTRVFVGQNTAAGVGITLTAADSAILVEPSWVPEDNNQMAGRIHRIGQDRGTLVRFATLTQSLDEAVMNVVRRKTADIQRLLD